MRKMIVFLVFLFVATFAYAAGSHLAGKGRALAVGVIIGVVASIPATLVSIVLTARTTGSQPVAPPPEAPARPTQAPPPVVIVNSGQATRSARYAPFIGSIDAPQARTFTVIGDEER